MFTSSDIMLALGVGLGFGIVAGIVGTVVLVVDPLRRERKVFRDRIIAEQLRTYAVGARLVAQQMLKDRQTDPHSRKVPDLKAGQMTRRQAGVLALLTREPMTTHTLAVALDERINDVAADLNKLAAAGVVEHTEDGWRLTDKVAA